MPPRGCAFRDKKGALFLVWGDVWVLPAAQSSEYPLRHTRFAKLEALSDRCTYSVREGLELSLIVVKRLVRAAVSDRLHSLYELLGGRRSSISGVRWRWMG